MKTLSKRPQLVTVDISPNLFQNPALLSKCEKTYCTAGKESLTIAKRL